MKARLLGTVAACSLLVSSSILAGAASASAKSPEPEGQGQLGGHWTEKGWDAEPAAPGLKGYEKLISDRKLAAAKTLSAQIASGKAPKSTNAQALRVGASTTYKVKIHQQAQQTGSWCGPAAVSEALQVFGKNVSQATLAKKLKTNNSGTAWYGVWVAGSPSTGYPVSDVMNQYVGSKWRYSPAAVSSPSQTAINGYVSSTVYSIYHGSPVINDAWETKNSKYHLVGHPTDRTIFHWYTAYGVETTGKSVYYVDSAHSTKVSWGSKVPAFAHLSAKELVTINSGRGYVW